YFHQTAFRRELDGVGEEVPDNLLQPLGVTPDLAVPQYLWIEFRGEPDEFRVRRRANRFDRVVDHAGQVNRSDFDSQLAGDNPRRIEQIVDQPPLPLAIAADRLKIPPRLFGVDPLFGALDAGVTEHGVER